MKKINDLMYGMLITVSVFGCCAAHRYEWYAMACAVAVTLFLVFEKSKRDSAEIAFLKVQLKKLQKKINDLEPKREKGDEE